MTTFDGQTSQMICHGCGQVECDEYRCSQQAEQAPQYLCAECASTKRPNDRPLRFHYATSQWSPLSQQWSADSCVVGIGNVQAESDGRTMSVVVVNVRREQPAGMVYIGRTCAGLEGSVLGNPFRRQEGQARAARSITTGSGCGLSGIAAGPSGGNWSAWRSRRCWQPRAGLLVQTGAVSRGCHQGGDRGDSAAEGRAEKLCPLCAVSAAPFNLNRTGRPQTRCQAQRSTAHDRSHCRQPRFRPHAGQVAQPGAITTSA